MLTRLRKIIYLSLIIAASSYDFSLGQNQITLMPDGISIYQLDNGLQVLLIEKPSLPMVGINTVVKVGSAFETFKTSGMSHMLEHLLFNGTTTMSQKELYDSTDIIGGYNNAHTGEYFTNYMMVTPAENIVDGMKLQSAMLFDSTIPEDKFEKEKGIVLEEIAKSLAKANEQMERNIRSIIYDGHALALPTLGTYSTIANMNRDEVNDFYKSFYVPNNMIVSVIGNFKSEEMLNNIKDLYGNIKAGEINNKSIHNSKTRFDRLKISNKNKVFHRFYKGEKTHLQLCFEVEQPVNFEFFDVLQIGLDENKDTIQSELKIIYGEQIEGIDFTIRETPVINYIEATLTLNNDNSIESIRKSFLDLFFNSKIAVAEETIKNESIKARTNFLKNIEKPHMFGIYNADLFAEHGIEAILSSYSGTGYLKAFKNIQDFNLTEEYITIIQHPESVNTSESISKEEDIKLLESTNGNPTIIVKHAPVSDLLAIHYLIKNKNEFENKHGKDAAKTWHDAFGKRMESSDIHKLSSKFGFTFTVNDNPFIPMDNIYLSPEFGYIRVEGLADDIESAIKFVNDQMISFTPTIEEFESAVGKSKRPSMMGHGNAAKQIFDSKLNSVLYENIADADKPELSYENLLEFGKHYFTPANMIISVVSPEKNIEQHFKNFKSANFKSDNKSGVLKEFKNLSEPQEEIVEGGGEQSYLYYGFQKNIEESEKAAIKVLSLLLSDKIIFDLREKQGLAYRMSAGIDVKKDKAMFYINMGTRPENVDKLIPQFPKFFTKGFVDEVTSSAVKKAVNMYLGRMMFRRLSSINQAYYLGHSKYFYDDIYYDTKFLEGLKTVNVADIKSVINKYMAVQNPIEIYVR